jgi:hypothetical protein
MIEGNEGMMRANVERLLVCATAFGILSTPMPANAATVPDFSGLWGRNAFNFEPLPAGPKPVTNLERLPDGTANRTVLVGDYTNPILRPRGNQDHQTAGRDGAFG